MKTTKQPKTTSLPSLGQLQINLELATKKFKTAQQSKLKADKLHDENKKVYEEARVALNLGVCAFKSSVDVTPLDSI